MGAIRLALRERCRFCQIRHEAARAGAPEGRAQVIVPTASRPAATRFPWKTNIVTTVFWIGEAAGGNNPVPNFKELLGCELDRQVMADSIRPNPSSRRNYIPVAFTPRQNPFYCRAALQRRHAWPDQAGSAAGDSLVQAGLHRARPIGLQAPLDCDSQGQSHLLTRNGKIAGHFAPIISNTFSRTSARSRI